MFLEVGLTSCPRMTILYLFLFEYKDIFLPIIHITSPVLENATELSLFSYAVVLSYLCTRFVIFW